MTPLIEIEALSKRFGRLTAVREVSFAVPRGQVLGFLGPNGAGKSTTMKMITGYLEPSGGRARVAGHDVVADPLAARRSLGYLPEGAPLYGDMTPAGLLRFVADVRTRFELLADAKFQGRNYGIAVLVPKADEDRPASISRKLVPPPADEPGATALPAIRISVANLAKLLSVAGEGRGLISICAAGGQGVTAILEK